jgi:molybdate transport repressor ModE-like protein
VPHISLRPAWTIQDAQGTTLPARTIELLVQVHQHGSLVAACQQLAMSYRHAWGLVRQAEAQFGCPLLSMERGKGSTLTPLGQKLVWADRRIQARLEPMLATLASELSAELDQVLTGGQVPLRLVASHGFAIETLVKALQAQSQPVERRYGSSTEAAAALHDRTCDVAGLHVPVGSLQASALLHYGRWLGAPDLCVIDVATRRQGLMVASGNPKKVYDLGDLPRADLRFVNRQAGSGTRFLLEGLLAQQQLVPSTIAGFEQGEFTHAAVAAFVASDMADVGFGLETPARQFKLDFLPLAAERYFLLARADTVASGALQAWLQVLASADFKARVDALPGYEARNSGRVQALAAAF